jgi:hypothetical protein
MGNYDGIQVPVQGLPISSTQYGIKVRDAIIDIDQRMRIMEANLNLPASVSVQGFGTNTLASAANTWANLPTTPAVVAFTNPSTDFDLVVDVYYGAWLSVSTGDVRAGVALSGGVTATPNPGAANQPVGWGLFPLTTLSTSDQHMGFFQVIIPKSVAAVTFTMQGWRSSGAATAQVNYGSIYVVPRKYQ